MHYDLVSGPNTSDIRRLTFQSTGALVMLVSRTMRDSPAIRPLASTSHPECVDTAALSLVLVGVSCLLIPPILISLMYLILAFKCKGITRFNVKALLIKKTINLCFCSVYSLVFRHPMVLLSGLLCHLTISRFEFIIFVDIYFQNLICPGVVQVPRNT